MMRVAGPVLAVGKAEPVGENAVFGNAVQDAIGADDGGIDGAGENQEADDHDEAAEDQAQHLRAPTCTWRGRRSDCLCKPERGPRPGSA